MKILDLTSCPAGQFAGFLLAELGHDVLCLWQPRTQWEVVAYAHSKRIIEAEKLPAVLDDLQIILIDRWAGGDAWLKEKGWWDSLCKHTLIVRMDDGIGPGQVATGFLLDHGLGFSDELPAGNAYREGYGGPSLALPGCVTDHDAGVQAALVALAWAGRTGIVDFSIAQAAMVTHRYSADIAELEPDTFVVRDPKAGIPFGGVLKCADGYLELVVFTAGAWRAVADWLGNPEWTRHPEFPTKAYVDAHAEQYQGEILSWAATCTVEEVLTLADRDGVPAARYATVEEAAADPYRVQVGYTEVQRESGRYLPSLPYWPPFSQGGSEAIQAADIDLQRPLAGVVVVDFTVAQAGAHTAWVLAQLGASVIKIEHRDKTDIARLWTPGKLDTSFAFMEPNAGKHSFLVEWDSPPGRALLFELVARADVFLTNVRPSILERIQMTAEDIRGANPSIIYATISSDGTADPVRANRPGWAMTFGAASGMGCAVTGDESPPSEVSGWADYAVGNQAALAILHLLRAGASGERIDTNAVAALSLLLRDTAIRRQLQHVQDDRRGMISCKDGVVVYDRTFIDADLPSVDYTDNETVLAQLRAAGIPCARQVSMEDVFQGRNAFGIEVYWNLKEHVVLGAQRRTVKPAWSINGVPVASDLDAPWLGEHTREIAERLLGLSDDAIQSAESNGILG